MRLSVVDIGEACLGIMRTLSNGALSNYTLDGL